MIFPTRGQAHTSSVVCFLTLVLLVVVAVHGSPIGVDPKLFKSANLSQSFESMPNNISEGLGSFAVANRPNGSHPIQSAFHIEAHKLGIGASELQRLLDKSRLKTSGDYVACYDKAENNVAQVAPGKSAWGQVYTFSTGASRNLNLLTNSFCAGGSAISNGVIVSVGGNPSEKSNRWAWDGLTAIRLYGSTDACRSNPKQCDVYEAPSLKMRSKRWYASTTRLQDGSILISGGSISGAYTNRPKIDNPTQEFWPPKNGGAPIYSQFLRDALKTNLFPFTALLARTGHVFMAANSHAMIYDWVNNVEHRLPDIPNGVKINYPATAATTLLPMTVANDFATEVLFCGGSAQDVDHPWKLSAKTSMASTQCARLVVDGTRALGGWKVEEMPEPRLMANAVLIPDGKVILINGAQAGVAGYGQHLGDHLGDSNAGIPNYRPTLYNPAAVSGSRFFTNLASSRIARMYHSSVLLLPSGIIVAAGSNPNQDVSIGPYPTELRLDFFWPSYAFSPRPDLGMIPTHINYGVHHDLTFTRKAGASSTIRVVLIDTGFSTHGLQMNQRLLELRVSGSPEVGSLSFIGPQDTTYYPPGPGRLWILENDIPSMGKRVMVGSGAPPPGYPFGAGEFTG
ncbi:BQ2448_5563 [Microbotryum intermedium]|uniref:BQ2448_5563 protein n=1 Tax=Microbotryum intermedium TaxID=269621 RepID=A0A238F1J9_9BASI|nr:BQ2448_5563 [Microbotryum intermedium]